MKNSSVRPAIVNVAFLNAIPAGGTNGCTMAERFFNQVDANGIGMFAPEQPSGIFFTTMTSESGYVANSSEAQQIITFTEPALAANTDYGFILSQVNPFTGQIVISQPIIYNTGTGALAAGTAVAAWLVVVNGLNAQGFHITAVNSGNGVLTITAASGYPIVYSGGLIGGVTYAVTTAGKYGVGNVNDMTAQNQTGAPWSTYEGYSAAIAATGYDYIELDYVDPYDDNQPYITYLFINISDANYAAWKAIFYVLWLQGTPGGGGAEAWITAALGVVA